MKEKIILINNINGVELLRSMSIYGVNSFGLRVFDSYSLAKYVLEKQGIFVNKRVISLSEKCAIIFSFINTIEYFNNASYTDACNLANAFSIIQNSIYHKDILEQAKQILNTDIFIEKNSAIIKALQQYLNFLDDHDLYDRHEYIRFAISKIKPCNADFICVNEFDLDKLSFKLLESVSDNCYHSCSFIELFKGGNSNKQIPEIARAYGSINEVEYILDKVYREHNLDECVVAVSNPKTYGQLLYSVTQQYNIPATFSFGISINNSNPYILLKALLYWDGPGLHCVDSLYELLTCQALNQHKLFEDLGFADFTESHTILAISEYCGNLKLDLNSTSNIEKLSKLSKDDDLYLVAENFSNILQNGIVAFLENYVYLRDDTIDGPALKHILQEIDIFNQYNDEADFKLVLVNLSNKNLNRELSCPGKIHITDMNGLFSAPRKHVYICGLSANDFPGSAKENYLLLDNDLENLDSRFMSANKLIDKLELFDEISDFLASINCQKYLSFSYYNLAELKEQNASSVIYKITDDIKNCKKINYFDSRFSDSRYVCKKYINGTEISYSDEDINLKVDENLMDKSWSFSAINTYLTCPRSFYYNYVLKVPIIEPVDPFEVLNAAEIGTIAHKMMRFISQKHIKKDEFLELCKKEFDEFLINKPSLIDAKRDNAIDDFLNMMSSAYDFDISLNNNTILSELDIEAVHDKTGLKLHGFPDRIESDGVDNYVVDFKTGREIRHKENDPNTCLQILIYAYLCEKLDNPIKIKSGEFRYLRNNGVVNCTYDQASKDKMDDLLETFADGIKNNQFERCNKGCAFCSYKDICLLPGESDKEEEA